MIWRPCSKSEWSKYTPAIFPNITPMMKMIQSKFFSGQNVTICAGTKDPDYGFDIGGWSGRIDEIMLDDDETWIYEIYWDQQTLKKMGKALHQKCDYDNLDYTRMALDESDLKAA